MPNKRIEQLTNKPILSANDKIPISSNNKAFSSNIQSIKDFVLSGLTEIYSENATLSGNILTINNNNGTNFSVDLSTIKFTGNTSADCINDLYLSNLYPCEDGVTNLMASKIQRGNSTAVTDGSIALGTNNIAGFQQEFSGQPFTYPLINYTAFGPTYIAISGDVRNFFSPNFVAINNVVQIDPLTLSLYGGSSPETYVASLLLYEQQLYGDVTIFLNNTATPLTVSDNISLSGVLTIQEFANNTNTFSSGSDSFAKGLNSFVHSNNSIVSGDYSAILGGQNIIASADNTTYVPYLNIQSANTNNSIEKLLVRNEDGTVCLRDTNSLVTDILYTNIIFVDNVNGDDFEASSGFFNKPFRSISSALSFAETLNPSIFNKILIYVRASRSYYFSDLVYLRNNVDFYCEPGVTFGDTTFRDDLNASGVTSNVYGSAKFESGINEALKMVRDSNITFEFDYIKTGGRIFSCEGNTTNFGNLLFKGNYASGGTNGTGHGCTIRNNRNVTIKMNQEFGAVHSTIDSRTFNGRLIVDTPILSLLPGNIFGGNFKQAIYLVNGATSAASYTFNCDIISRDPVYYGGISSLVSINSGMQGSVKINGNIVGGTTFGLTVNTNTPLAKIKTNGDISSDLLPCFLNGINTTYLTNGSIYLTNTVSSLRTIFMTGSVTGFTNNITLYSPIVNGDLITYDSTNAFLSLFNTLGFSEGTSGNTVGTTLTGGKYRFHNVRSNKPNNVNVIDTLSPSGFIFDPNLIIPKF